MEEEVQGGPARGRGRGGRGTRGCGRGRYANHGRGLDGLEDAAVGGRAVVRLIEEDMDIDVGAGVGMGVGMRVVELATLIGSGLLMLLKMVMTAMNSLLFWTFHIKRLEASRVWLAEGHVQRLAEGGARNIKLTDDMQAFIRDFVLQQPFTTITAVGQELEVRFPDTAILNQQFRFPARLFQNKLITTKIAEQLA